MGFLTKRTFRIVVPPVGRLPHFPLSQSGERGERRIGYRLGGHANAWSCSGSSCVDNVYSTAPAMDFGKARGQPDLWATHCKPQQLERRKWEMASK
jgi:hypothetical protein